MNKAAMLNQITAIRVMLDNLEAEIRKEPEPTTEYRCDHSDRRVLTTMGSPEEWICKNPRCGFHYKEERVEV